MNEQLQTRLESYLSHLENAALSATDFAAEQAPLVVSEYLTWYWYSSLFLAVVTGILASATLSTGAFCIYKQIQADKARIYNDCGYGYVGSILSCVSVVVYAFAGGHLYNLILVSIAPRLVVLEYVRSLLG